MNEAPSFDWATFEEELFEELRHALADLGRERPEARFYAVALHGVDRQPGRLLSLPLLAAAIETDPPRADDASEGFWSAHWNPGDWELSEIELREGPALHLERALTAEANRDLPAHWRDVDRRYVELLVRVAVRLRDVAPALLDTTEDFVVFLSDEGGGPDLAALTIPPALFSRLFAKDMAAKRERARVAALPAMEQAAFWVTRFGEVGGLGAEAAQAGLLSLGEDALDALSSIVADRTNGWMAAKVLGQIGVSRPDLVTVLRGLAPGSHWHASALGMLGDDAWLARQPAAVAVHGLTAPLKTICAGRPRPLDYGALERYLDAASETTRALVEKELRPGQSYVTARGADVPEALRALGSRHAVIRWHAASLLGDHGLGRAAGDAVLAALAATLADENAIVRRLALLALAEWKPSASG